MKIESVVAAARKLERNDQVALLLCLAPCLLLLLLVFFLPLAEFLTRSVLDPAPTLRHFERIITNPIYGDVVLRTLRICGLATLCCLLLGYPVAYAIAIASPFQRLVLLALVLVPFWTSVLVRMFAWMALLGSYGLVNQTLMATGLIDRPLRILFSEGAVILGMVHYLLPYMILPCLAVMIAIPEQYMQAAEGLGAPRWRAFLRIYLPLSAPGAAAGCVLVFIIGLGFFVTPALLGGPRDVMFAQLLEQTISERLDWGLGAALSALLMAVTIALYALYRRLGIGDDARYG